MVAILRASKHARFLYRCAPLAKGLGFEAPRTRLHPLLSAKLHYPGITIEDVRMSDLLAYLTDVFSGSVSQDLWQLSVGIDNKPWGQYQPLIPLYSPRITDYRILDKIDEYGRNWLLHLQRMPQNRIPLKSYHYRPQGRRKIGRPKKRWRDQL